MPFVLESKPSGKPIQIGTNPHPSTWSPHRAVALILISARQRPNTSYHVSRKRAAGANPKSANSSQHIQRDGRSGSWEKNVSTSLNSIWRWINTRTAADDMRWDIRNPPLHIRLFIVAFIMSVFGGLGGLTSAVFVGHRLACILGGAVAGAVLGAMIERYGR